jgi:hypothetical protein
MKGIVGLRTSHDQSISQQQQKQIRLTIPAFPAAFATTVFPFQVMRVMGQSTQKCFPIQGTEEAFVTGW